MSHYDPTRKKTKSIYISDDLLRRDVWGSFKTVDENLLIHSRDGVDAFSCCDRELFYNNLRDRKGCLDPDDYARLPDVVDDTHRRQLEMYHGGTWRV